MKVIAINGSARKDGNTARLIRYVFEELVKEGIETELIQLAGHAIRGCTGCDKCKEVRNGKCVIGDDPVNECIAKMANADGIILGSPVYVANITPELLALIDRSGRVGGANGNLYKHKVGGAVIALRRRGALHALDSVNHFMHISQMILPGAQGWNVGVGRDVGDVEKDVEGIATMRSLGQNMAWLLKKING
jgi:multimeric flavodoxin WrbA